MMGNALRNKGDMVHCNIYVHFNKSLLFIRCKRGVGTECLRKGQSDIDVSVQGETLTTEPPL